MSMLREHLQNLWVLTLHPTLRRMFGKRRRGNTILLICTFFLIAAMLSVICLSYHINLRENDRLAADYTAYISSTAFTSDEASSAAARQAHNHILYSKMELTSVFIFLMTIWVILSTFALSRVFHATVERDNYVYGLYVTFGSDTRQIRRQIYTEFLMAALIALAAAIPAAFAAAAALCKFISSPINNYSSLLININEVKKNAKGIALRALEYRRCAAAGNDRKPTADC